MDQISQVREKIDIVQLISEFIPLKKMGRNFKANCPFHNEKSPSFVVSPERQIWHCFGCGKGGDCFSFLMEYEHMECAESLRTLAKRAGVTLENEKLQLGTTSKKEELYKLNRIAAEFYHYILTKHNVGKKALDYMTQVRKINEKVIETFQLGFAPHIGNALVTYLVEKKKYKPQDLLAAGLATQRGGQVVDFFFNRIMFPIIDHRDNVIGFSGRVFISESPTAKYINTRETLVYHKGEVFYGFNIAKAGIKKENKVIIMEGELDLISAFQEGITNVLAVKGSGLTEQQLHLLSRFTQNVALCFDQDSAGQEAIKKSLPFLEKKEIHTTVIHISQGKDPDEMLKTDPGAFKSAMKHDIGVYDYLLEKAIGAADPSTVTGKRDISDSVLRYFSAIQNEIVKEHYLKKLAQTLDTTYESIKKQADRSQSQIKERKVEEQANALKVKRKREEILEEYLLALILQHADAKPFTHLVVEILSHDILDRLSQKELVRHLLNYFQSINTFNSDHFSKGLPIRLLANFDRLFLLPVPQFPDDKAYAYEVRKVAQELHGMYVRTMIKELGEQIKQRQIETSAKGLSDDQDAELERLQQKQAELAARLK